MQTENQRILKALQAQADFLDAARINHLFLGEKAENPEIAHAHVEFTDVLVQAISRCNDLLDKYNRLAK